MGLGKPRPRIQEQNSKTHQAERSEKNGPPQCRVALPKTVSPIERPRHQDKTENDTRQDQQLDGQHVATKMKRQSPPIWQTTQHRIRQPSPCGSPTDAPQGKTTDNTQSEPGPFPNDGRRNHSPHPQPQDMHANDPGNKGRFSVLGNRSRRHFAAVRDHLQRPPLSDRAGVPATIWPGETLPTTVAPAPTVTRSPRERLGRITEPAPIRHSSPT